MQKQLVIPNMAFKIKSKEMYPIFFSESVIGQFTPKW